MSIQIKLHTDGEIYEEIGKKADKVNNATNGNFAGLDANGNLTDSGKAVSDFVGTDAFYATEMPVSEIDDTTVAEEISDLKSAIDNLGLSVVNGAICISYEEVSA